MTMRATLVSLLDTFAATVRSQRLTWTCCIVVSLLLVYRFKAPLIPVIFGCLLALILTGWNSRSVRSGAHR